MNSVHSPLFLLQSMDPKINSQGYVLGLYSAVFNICIETPLSKTLFYLQLLFLFIWELSFPFSISIEGSQLYPFSPAVCLRLLWTGGASFFISRIVAFIITIFIYLNTFCIIYIVHYYSRRTTSDKIHPLLSKLFTSHLKWTTGPLMVPYMAIPLNYILSSNPDPILLRSFISSVDNAWISLALFFHIIIASVFSFSIYEWHPASLKPNSRSHSRLFPCITFMNFVASFLLALGTAMAESGQTTTGISIFSVFVFLTYQIGGMIGFLLELPFYRLSVNRVYVSIYAVATMTSLASLLRLMIPDAGDSMCLITLFLGSVFLVPSVNLLIKRWKNNIIKKDLHGFKHIAEWDIRIRDMFHSLYNIIDEEAFSSNDDILLKKKKISQDLEILFTLYSQYWKGSLKLHLQWATYLFCFEGNRLKGIQKLRHAKCNMVLEPLPLQTRLRYISESARAEEYESGLKNHNEQRKYESIAMTEIAFCLGFQNKFWGALLSRNTSCNTLEKITSSINIHTQDATKCLQHLIALNSKDSAYRRLYAAFLSEVVNDEAEAKVQLKRALEIEAKGEVSRHLSDSSNAIVIVSVEAETFGKILEVNPTCCNVFAQSSKDLVLKHIANLMPEAYAQIHDERVHSYFQKPQQRDKNKLGVLIKDAQGFLLEADVKFMEYPNYTYDPSLTFFSAILPHSPRMLCIVRKKDLIVSDISQMFYLYFQPNLQTLKEAGLCIDQIVPNFEPETQSFSRLMNEDTLSYNFLFKFRKGDMETVINVIVSNLKYLEDEFFHVLFERNRVHGDDNEWAELFSHPTSNISAQRRQSMIAPTPGKTARRNSLTQPVLVSSPGNIARRQSLAQPLIASPGNITKRQSVIQPTVGIPTLAENFKNAISENLKFVHIVSNEDNLAMDSNKSISDDTESDEKPQELEDKEDRKSLILRQCLVELNRRQDHKTVAFSRWVAILIAILCILGVCNQILYSILAFNRHKAALDFLNTPLNDAILSSSYSALSLQHTLQESFLFSNMTNAAVENARVKSEFSEQYNNLKPIIMYMFEDKSSMTDQELTFLQQTKFNINNRNGLNKSYTLNMVVIMYLNAMANVINQTFSNLLPFAPLIQMLMVNHQAEVVSQWKTFAADMIENHEATENTIWLNQVALFALSTLCTLGLFMVVFIPFLYSFLQQRYSIQASFAKISDQQLNTGFEISGEKFHLQLEATDIKGDMIQVELADDTAFEAQSSMCDLGRKKVRLFKVLYHPPFLRLLLIPMLSTIYYLIYLIYWTPQNWEYLSGLEKRMVLGIQRSTIIHQMTFYAICWNSSTIWGDSILATTKEWSDLEVELLDIEHDIMYGNASLQIPDIRTYEGGDAIVTQSLCTQLEIHPVPCESFASGILTQGQHATLVYLKSLSEDIRNQLHNFSMYPTQENAESLKGLIWDLKNLRDYWIPSILGITNEWVYQTIWERMVNNTWEGWIITVAFAVILLFLMRWVYSPMARQLNVQLQQSRNLFTIVPTEILEDSTVLTCQLQQVIKDLI